MQETLGCRRGRRCRSCERCRGTEGAEVQKVQGYKWLNARKNPQPGRLERAQLNGSACPASVFAPPRASREDVLSWRHRRPRTGAAIRRALGTGPGGRHLVPHPAGPRRAAPPSQGAAPGGLGPGGRGRDPLGHPRHEGARRRPRPPSWTGARQGWLPGKGRGQWSRVPDYAPAAGQRPGRAGSAAQAVGRGAGRADGGGWRPRPSLT